MNLTEWRSENSQDAYLVSNTPRYLCKKLRNDPAVARIGRAFSSQDIESALLQVLKISPREIADHVRPAALLAALSLKNDVAALKRAQSYDGVLYRWYKEVASLLADSHVGASALSWDIAPKTELIIGQSRGPQRGAIGTQRTSWK